MTASLIFSSERLFYNVSIPQIALGVSNSPTMAASSPLFAKRSAHDTIHIGVCESIMIKICNINTSGILDANLRVAPCFQDAELWFLGYNHSWQVFLAISLISNQFKMIDHMCLYH